MPSLFSWVGRLTRYLTGTRASSSMDMEFENRYIFPNVPPRGAQYFDHSYVPWELLDAIQKDRDAVDGIDHIYVSSARYYKKPKGAQHEFLMFVLKDSTCNSRQNAIIIDRVASPGRIDNRDSPPDNLEDLAENDHRALRRNVLASVLTSSHEPIARRVSSNSSSISDSFNGITGVPALDMCRVSASGGFEDMAERLTLTPCTCIAELKFSDKSFTLEKLLNLAAAVSNHEPRYDLLKTQCYWYALMLWELVQRVSKTTATPGTSTMVPGSNSLVPWLLAHNHGAERQKELEELVAEYERRWQSFLEELPQWKNRGVKALMNRPIAPLVQEPPIVAAGQ
ncbi:unnamed protein product [Rhizoctonia solani]|uniref:Uncharacterized protein n=1 Tax=Rhizoctonia solani TaxID=456999 RepID=A0A8H3DYS5_9AGAM|nr:unnamed protein product [Rhizoctonia solani]